jgi:hypothetical protein
MVGAVKACPAILTRSPAGLAGQAAKESFFTGARSNKKKQVKTTKNHLYIFMPSLLNSSHKSFCIDVGVCFCLECMILLPLNLKKIPIFYNVRRVGMVNVPQKTEA